MADTDISTENLMFNVESRVLSRTIIGLKIEPGGKEFQLHFSDGTWIGFAAASPMSIFFPALEPPEQVPTKVM